MNKHKLYKTNLLVGKSDFLIGVGSIFNIAGNYYSFNYSSSGLEADTRALANDWGVVGQDIQESIDKIEYSKAPQLEFDFNE